jgi:putative PIN family toxin of toxin-antitoxin system
MIRAVTDANVLISGTIAPKGASAAVLNAWRDGVFDAVVCPKIVSETIEKLALPRIRKKYAVVDDDVVCLVRGLSEFALCVEGTTQVALTPADPDDVMLFASAMEAAADFIVTGDKALWAFKWPGRAQVVSPRDFLGKLHE